MPANIITLMSDFGLKDPYVAEMKAVILTRCPTVEIIDISHMIDKFDIRMGAFVLASAAPYFPRNTVHVAVVDPGVGTKRRAIVIKTALSYFVGPDNGLLTLAALRQGIEHVHIIQNSKYVLSKISKTFHGRDVFAPVAAHLARGCIASDFGEESKDYVVPVFAKPCIEKDFVKGEVLHIDEFGNIITNVSSEMLRKVTISKKRSIKIELHGETKALKFCSAYGDVALGESLAIVGGHNFLEISVNQGNAAKLFKGKIGDEIHVW